MTTRLIRLSNEHGQSPWLDNLQRSYLASGHLRALIDAGVRGLTSNPTIFQKAIQGSRDYDDDFHALMARGLSPVEAYWEMVVSDIEGALELFAPVYEASGTNDGFVSVEVNPSLAHDGAGTLDAARALAARFHRPNVMIKIPATREGLPAIRTMIADGRNVNVTLIFSLDRYDEVIEAHLAGLEDRLKAGRSLVGVHSVASFFISRVDSEIDPLLEADGSTDALALRGTAAISQAVLAYEMFCTRYSGPRWEALAAAGASVQRPLWASTSTKNPSYRDTLYVDSLIGPSTVNTLPEATLEAYQDHGSLARTIDSDVETARRRWDSLARHGVDTKAVAEKLERDGVESFIKSFDDLISTLAEKATKLG